MNARERLFVAGILVTLLLVIAVWWRGATLTHEPDPTGGARVLNRQRIEQMQREGTLSEREAQFWHTLEE